MKELHSIGQSVFIADKYFRLFFKNAVKKYDLNRAEAMTLMMLCTDRSLADLHFDKGVLSRTVQSLESKGLVTKKTSAVDARANDIEVTEAALEIGHKLDRIFEDWNEKVVSGIEDREMFARMLSIIAENAEQLANEKGNGKSKGKDE